jgi:AcrR family transcriptional regulator
MAYRETERVKARKDAVRQGILDAARVLVASGGFGAAQMADLAMRAGIATGTLYRYFPTKSDLFAEVFRVNSQREVDAFATAAKVGDSCSARLENAIRTFAHRAIKGRRIAYSLIAEPVDPSVDVERLIYRKAYAKVLETLIDDGIRAGEFPRQDSGITAAAQVGAMAEALVGPLSPSAQYGDSGDVPHATRELLIQSIVTYCMRAVGAKDHRHDR